MAKKFDKDRFDYHGGYLTYQGEFVARFKYRGPITMAKFKKELIKNHTPLEYFHQLNVEKKSPVAILDEVNPHWSEEIVNSWLARKGVTR